MLYDRRAPFFGMPLRCAPVTDPSPTAEIELLILATAAGDREAFRALYDATSGRLFGIVVRVVRRADWAEDILQEVYVRIWRHAARYRPERGSPMPWLATIARNGALDWRRRNTGGIWAAATEDGENPDLQEAGALDWTDAAEDARALRHCLDELESEPRTCIVLAYTEGLTHDELASRLSRPIGTVKSWIRRGLHRLKDCLDR